MVGPTISFRYANSQLINSAINLDSKIEKIQKGSVRPIDFPTGQGYTIWKWSHPIAAHRYEARKQGLPEGFRPAAPSQ